MIYIILNSDKKVINQFKNYDIAFKWCLEAKNKQLVYLVCIDTDTFEIKSAITF